MATVATAYGFLREARLLDRGTVYVYGEDWNNEGKDCTAVRMDEDGNLSDFDFWGDHGLELDALPRMFWRAARANEYAGRTDLCAVFDASRVEDD